VDKTDEILTLIENSEGGATLTEIQEGLNLKKRAAMEILNQLMSNGLVTREKQRPRGWRNQRCTDSKGPPRVFFYRVAE